MLDLGLASPDRYAGLDSSRSMLNLLVRKHPRVAAVYPVDIRDVLSTGAFTPGQFDWVFLDAAVDLTTRQLSQLEAIARRAIIVINGPEWTVRDVAQSSSKRILAEAEALKAAS